MPFNANITRNLIEGYKNAPILLEKYLKDNKIIAFSVIKEKNRKWAAYELTSTKMTGWATYPHRNLKREAMNIILSWAKITKLPII